MIAGILALVVAVFQLALALGAPWGSLAWGGGHERRLPARLRAGSVASAAVMTLIGWFFLSVALDLPSPVPSSSRSAFAWLVSVLFAVGTLMNAASRSRSERAVWTPVAAMLCACSAVTALSL